MNNPTAFPVNTENVNNPGAAIMELGMSLRDYFAANIIQGIVICLYREEANDTRNSWDKWDKKMTERAYKLSDQMLKAREI